jgi:hypothetical protein
MAAGSVLARLAGAAALAGAVATGACGDREQPRVAETPTATATATATPSPRPDVRAPAWTHATVLRRLTGRRVRVAGRRLRIDRSTLTCGGVGGPTARVDGEAAWTRFRCVQPTFPPGELVGPDAIFFLEPRGPRTFAVTGGRFSRY